MSPRPSRAARPAPGLWPALAALVLLAAPHASATAPEPSPGATPPVTAPTKAPDLQPPQAAPTALSVAAPPAPTRAPSSAGPAAPPRAPRALPDAGPLAHDASAHADGGVPAELEARWNDTAHVIAGLPVPAASPLAPSTATAAFALHAQELDAGFGALTEARLAPMDTWARAELDPRIPTSAPLVYFFGGPDALSVDVLYPDAPSYVLFGLEVPGAVPPLETLPPADLDRSLTNLRSTLRTTLRLSYFVTSAMGGDMKKTPLKGVLPVMLLFLARHGDTVLDAEPIALDANGVAHAVPAEEAAAASVPGLRLHFRRGGVGPVRQLDYFSLDLINDALPQRPGLFPYLAKLGRVNAFLKAASFILHDRHFSRVRDWLLGNSASILQDDSGLPWRAFPRGRWDFVFFGEYTPNKKVFEDHFQEDLKKAWSDAAVRPLPFATGYPHVKGSNLMLATPRPAGTAADAGTPLP